MTSDETRWQARSGGEISLFPLAFATGLLPFAVVQLCYVISVQAGHVPACIPYFTGCTSISAAGRHGAAFFIFKAGMIPAAVLMACYWALCRQWLLRLGGADALACRSMVVLGLVSALFLVLYTVYLGSKGDFYNLMRRFGVNVHLSFSALAQIMLVRQISHLPAPALARLPGWIIRGKQATVGLLLGIGLLSIPVGNFMPDKGRAGNVIEWTFAAVMGSFYLLSGFAWRATAFRAGFSAGSRFTHGDS